MVYPHWHQGHTSKNWPANNVEISLSRCVWRAVVAGGRLSGPAPGYACVLLDGTVLTNGSFHAEWRACHAVPARSLLLSFTSVQVATHAQRAAGQQVMGWGPAGSAPLAGRGHGTRAANNSALQVHVPPMAIFFV